MTKLLSDVYLEHILDNGIKALRDKSAALWAIYMKTGEEIWLTAYTCAQRLLQQKTGIKPTRAGE